MDERTQPGRSTERRTAPVVQRIESTASNSPAPQNTAERHSRVGTGHDGRLSPSTASRPVDSEHPDAQTTEWAAAGVPARQDTAVNTPGTAAGAADRRAPSPPPSLRSRPMTDSTVIEDNRPNHVAESPHPYGLELFLNPSTEDPPPWDPNHSHAGEADSHRAEDHGAGGQLPNHIGPETGHDEARGRTSPDGGHN